MWDNVVTMPYGDRFRKHRRLMAQVLNSQAIDVYRDFQVNNTKVLLKNLLRDPEKFDQHILRFVSALVALHIARNATNFSCFSL